MIRRRVAVAVLSAVVAATVLGACGGDGGAAPSDPVLAQGQTVYKQNCAQCHGSKGGGGMAPKLAGVIAARYPNIEDHMAVIRDGRGGMPKFGQKLTPEEIEAVARWEREGL